MQLLSKVFDLILLNLLTIVCSLPIITIGASLSGLCYSVNHMIEGEGYPLRDYFKAFASNFRQATALWLIWLAAAVLIIAGLGFYIGQDGLNTLLVAFALLVLGAAALIWLLSFSWVFILQSRFDNPVKVTARNAIMCGSTNLFPSLFMAVMTWLPMALYWIAPYGFFSLAIVWLLIWFSFSAYVNVGRANKAFSKIQEKS
ncbi:MAG: YesL family protein [Firmicutes bacterium]|nr:YesL family protein [Bacillota bacterium]